MTRKVNTVNRGRASHYVNGAQPLKMGFSRDLARLKFNRTYVCKPDEVKRDLVAVDSMKKAGVTSEQVPEHVTNALTRDYSGLMKALNKDK